MKLLVLSFILNALILGMVVFNFLYFPDGTQMTGNDDWTMVFSAISDIKDAIPDNHQKKIVGLLYNVLKSQQGAVHTIFSYAIKALTWFFAFSFIQQITITVMLIRARKKQI